MTDQNFKGCNKMFFLNVIHLFKQGNMKFKPLYEAINSRVEINDKEIGI
jgi:hypothetical protein